MSFPFDAPARAYGGGELETPYARARQEWDARMGAAVLSARAWRTMALGALAIIAVLCVSLAVVALQKRTFVHVVEVSPEGQVLSVRAMRDAWTPSEAQIAYHLARFVRLVRALPTDGVVLRENWLEAYRLLTPAAAAQLSERARRDDPFLSLGRVGRTVHVRSIIARSPTTWEVSWTERATNATGSADGESFSGVFTVATRAPRNADELASNPIGLFITDFSWSQVR